MRRRFLSAAALIGVALSARLGTTQPVAASVSAPPFYESRDFSPRWTQVSHRVAPFELKDQTNRTFTERDLDGRIHVASFLFAECPSICPMLVSRLKPVQSALKARGLDDVLMVSYSVTPLTDTPEVLAEFGRLRGIDPAYWRLATGDPVQIARLIRESYFADDDRKIDGALDARLLHTEKILLVDRDRRLRGLYNGTNAFELERLLEDIDALLREESQAGETDPRGGKAVESHR